MKKLYVILFCLLTLVCGQEQEWREELEKLQERVLQLEQDNQELKDQLEATDQKSEEKHSSHKNEEEKHKEHLGSKHDHDHEHSEHHSQPKNQTKDDNSIFSLDIGDESSLKLLDISFSVLSTVGTSTATNEQIEQLQAGDHDPRKRGFTLQQAELSATGAIDPYAKGFINILLLIDPEGETKVELEEAFLVSTSLPHGFEVKFGQFYTEFGLHNPTHAHRWDFVDQPIILARFFGPDGLRNPGARVSWQAPLPWKSKFMASGQNANGETAVSFLSLDEEEEGFGESFAGHDFIDRDVSSLKDILYMLRWVNSFEVSEELTAQAGYSFLHGPNATGRNASTMIHGWDLYFKWQPKQHDHSSHHESEHDSHHESYYLTWHTEVLYRRYEAEKGNADREFLDDFGFFTQLVWGIEHDWSVAARYDFSRGDQGLEERNFLRDERHRVSGNATYYVSDFLKFRLQYNWDKAQFLGSSPEHSFWLQVEFFLGSHRSHNHSLIQ